MSVEYKKEGNLWLVSEAVVGAAVSDGSTVDIAAGVILVADGVGEQLRCGPDMVSFQYGIVDHVLVPNHCIDELQCERVGDHPHASAPAVAMRYITRRKSKGRASAYIPVCALHLSGE